MSTLRSLLAILLFLALAVTASAQDSGGKEKPNHEPLFAAIDTNKDGCMTEEEWRAAGAPMSSFNGLVKDGCVTREIMLAAEAPDGIDLNGDGFFTIEEFREFDKIMSVKMAEQGGGGSPPGGAAENRPTISKVDRVYEMWQVQNTFSKHAYYHGAGKHCEELADIWVKEDGEFAPTAKWTNPQGIQESIALIKKNYCTNLTESKKKLLAELSKIYPELKNVPENLGAGYEWAMHTQTTPIIEIAGDGKTAKGLWYSPGIRESVQIIDDNAVTAGGWFWEKYGVDFVKEDGKWKIWHIQMCYDNTPPSWGGQEKAPVTPTNLENVDTIGGLEMSSPNPDPYQAWSPTTVPRIQPRFPEPYYTFSETFSY